MNFGKLLLIFCIYGKSLMGNSSGNCFSELEIPQYPDLARQARISGISTVSFNVDQQGNRPTISVKAPHKILEDAVTESMKKSILNKNCTDKEIKIQFIFELAEPAREINTSKILFRSPDTFVIRSKYFPVSGSSAQD